MGPPLELSKMKHGKAREKSSIAVLVVSEKSGVIYSSGIRHYCLR